MIVSETATEHMKLDIQNKNAAILYSHNPVGIELILPINPCLTFNLLNTL